MTTTPLSLSEHIPFRTNESDSFLLNTDLVYLQIQIGQRATIIAKVWWHLNFVEVSSQEDRLSLVLRGEDARP